MTDGYVQDDKDYQDIKEQTSTSLTPEEIYTILGCEALDEE